MAYDNECLVRHGIWDYPVGWRAAFLIINQNFFSQMKKSQIRIVNDSPPDTIRTERTETIDITVPVCKHIH